jgi:hypothetical protein
VSTTLTKLPPRPDQAATSPTRFKKAAAILGIVLGFLFYIVPGIFAWRSYRRWKRGEIRRPTFAWVSAAIALPLIVATGIIPFYILYGMPLIDEDFSGQVDGWPSIGRPHSAQVVDGGYELTVETGREGDLTLAGLRWNEGARPNVAVESSTQLLVGDAIAGPGCFDANRNLGYAFLIGGGGWEVQEVRNGSGSLIDAGDLGTSTTGVLRVRGECRGGYGDHELRMFVDGSLVATIPAGPDPFDFTAVGLVLEAKGSNAARARFDDVSAISIQP